MKPVNFSYQSNTVFWNSQFKKYATSHHTCLAKITLSRGPNIVILIIIMSIVFQLPLPFMHKLWCFMFYCNNLITRITLLPIKLKPSEIWMVKSMLFSFKRSHFAFYFLITDLKLTISTNDWLKLKLNKNYSSTISVQIYSHFQETRHVQFTFALEFPKTTKTKTFLEASRKLRLLNFSFGILLLMEEEFHPIKNSIDIEMNLC